MNEFLIDSSILAELIKRYTNFSNDFEMFILKIFIGLFIKSRVVRVALSEWKPA